MAPSQSFTEESVSCDEYITCPGLLLHESTFKQIGFLCLIFIFKKQIKKIYVLLGWGEEKERETNISVREMHDLLPLTNLQLGTWPATQACALAGIEPALSICRLAFSPLSHTARAGFLRFKEMMLRGERIKV